MCHNSILFHSIYFITDRQSKLNSENADRTSNLANICVSSEVNVNVSHPPSITSNDEGGFNEPSPDIKAKLKPAYTFEPLETQNSEKDEEVHPEPDEAKGHHLHYVDFGYRLNPDGSESKHCFGDEAELYADRGKNGLPETNIVKAINGFTAKESVVYATIKTDIPPPPPPIDFDTNDSSQQYRQDIADASDDADDIDAKFEQIYRSPQNELDTNLPNASDGDDVQNSDQLFETLAKAELPDGSSLDIQDVEYADASDKEELPDDMTSFEADRLLSSRYVNC